MRNQAPTKHPDLLVGIDGSDDAGVFRLSDDLALVQTVDYLTPVVDEAHDWGRIAAANALSDVYAMGGTPLTALQIVGWPRDTLSLDLLSDVIDGGMATLAEAGVTLVGGHSLDDPEPKYGLAVTGTVHPDRVVTNAGASPNEALVLTKPIGIGVITTAIKGGLASPQARNEAVEVMSELNAVAAVAMLEVGVSAATDVTGFGLLGHLGEIVAASGVGARIDAHAVPVLAEARSLAEAGAVAGGTERNLAHVEQFTDFGDADESTRVLLADAQTSGGLLIAVESAKADQLVEALQLAKTASAALIGHTTARAGSIEVR